MADQTNIGILDSEKVTPEPKRFCKYTSDSESDHLQNNIVMEEVLFHHDDPQSDTDSAVQSSTSPSTSHTLPSQPPIIFTTTEGYQDIHIDGYHQELYRNDRNCFGGGVLVYVSEILKTKRRLDLEFENGELIWLEIDFPQHKILLCAVYRSPGSSHPFWQNFKHSIEQAYNYTTKIVITGDLNVDLFTEHNHVLNDLMNIFCLQNVVKEATRFDHRSGRATLLDPILISEDCCASFTEIIDINRQMSDHNATKEQFYLNANGLLDEKSNKNPKAFWSLVKKVMGNCRSTSIPPLLNPNTNEISVGEKEKADLLNSYFCNISTSSDDGVTPPDLPLRTQHSLDIDEITEDEIKDILKSLEIGNQPGRCQNLPTAIINGKIVRLKHDAPAWLRDYYGGMRQIMEEVIKLNPDLHKLACESKEKRGRTIISRARP
ncbi:unnamed protein product [Mytilus coruscus]|uniref:Endonuclease/exonuclease/phosphatase domain-containing protein n=1 Tax=Mytilus coruscus TaxID=42192 RepID=A0A6J8EEL5_MYTCO|nr:unnamed protein product [Mytilus coruscus]